MAGPFAANRLCHQKIQKVIGYFDDLTTAVKTAAAEGKCNDVAMRF